MYVVEEGGAGTIQGREKWERGQSQSEVSGESDDSDGEDETGRGRQTKKVCMEGWRGRETQSDKEIGAGAFREAQKKFPYLSQRICFPFISLYF